MQGLLPRNLKYTHAFVLAWPDTAIVQGVIAQFMGGVWKPSIGDCEEKLPSLTCWVSGVVTSVRRDEVDRTLMHLRRADGSISTGFFPVILNETVASDLAREIRNAT
jgi:hypothetical protein